MPVNVGFGTTTDRFTTSVAKPRRPQKVSFRIPSPITRYKKKKSVSLWERQQETEKYIHDLQFNPVIAQNLRIKRSVGPGYYDLNISTFKESNLAEGAVFGTSKRSILTTAYKTPGPSTYFPNICERSFVLKKYFGTKSLFGEPYRWSRNKYENNRIPPNRYRLKSGIDELLQKRVSKKGPYQTFTGPRDLSTIRNHFAPANSLGDHFYIGLNSSVDFLLNHPSKKNFGVVYRTPARPMIDYCDRLHKHTSTCVLPKQRPGPCSYNITQHTIKPAKESKVPFNSTSKQWTDQLPTEQYAPGPGRYFLDGFNLDSSRPATPKQRLARIKSSRKSYTTHSSERGSSATRSTKSRTRMFRKRVQKLKEQYYKTLLKKVEGLATRRTDTSPDGELERVCLPDLDKRNKWILGLDPKVKSPVRTCEKIISQHTAVRAVSIDKLGTGRKLDSLYVKVTVDPDSNIKAEHLVDYYKRRTKRKLPLQLKIVKPTVEKPFVPSRDAIGLSHSLIYQRNSQLRNFFLLESNSSYRLEGRSTIGSSASTRLQRSRSSKLATSSEQSARNLLRQSSSIRKPLIELMKPPSSTNNPWKGLIKMPSSIKPQWSHLLKRLGSAKHKRVSLADPLRSYEKASNEMINQSDRTKHESKELVKQSSSSRSQLNRSRLGSIEQKSSHTFSEQSSMKDLGNEFMHQSSSTQHPLQEFRKRSAGTALEWNRSLKRLGSAMRPPQELAKQTSSTKLFWQGYLKQLESSEDQKKKVLVRRSIIEPIELPDDKKHSLE